MGHTYMYLTNLPVARGAFLMILKTCKTTYQSVHTLEKKKGSVYMYIVLARLKLTLTNRYITNTFK